MKKLWEFVNRYKVISGIVVVFLVRLVDKIFSLNIFLTIYTFLKQKYIISMWYLLFVGILPLVVFALVVFSSKKRKPAWISYTEDIIDDIEWTWRYIGNDMHLYDLKPLCPQCSRELHIRNTGTYRAAPRFKLICQGGHIGKDYEGEYEQLEDMIIREIQGKIRTGEYRKK